jgi:hypothetical protein
MMLDGFFFLETDGTFITIKDHYKVGASAMQRWLFSRNLPMLRAPGRLGQGGNIVGLLLGLLDCSGRRKYLAHAG